MTPPRVYANWATAEVRARLGTVPDSTVATEVGVSKQAVQQVRVRLGISPSGPNEETSRRLSEAQRIHCPLHVSPMLGHVPDAAVARQCGVSSATVHRWRKEAGRLPVCGVAVVIHHVHLLGTMTDADVARQIGVKRTTIAHFRVRHPGYPLSPCRRRQSSE